MEPPQPEDSIYAKSTILVTGGTGSVGMELIRALLEHGAKQIRLLSNDENGLFEAMNSFAKHHEVVYRLGDIRDSRGVEQVIRDCDFVFHAAALKHVDFCEGNPYEAIYTNILGTQNVIDLATRHSVRRFVFISSDKSVNPVSTMGATKLLGEKLTVGARTSTDRPVFSVVRFGNVLGSRGSVVLIFEQQVKEGIPITVTDPEMTRFIMLPADSARLVLRAGELSRGGTILVLKMPAAKIRDLAEACREFFARIYGRDAGRIPITTIGAGPGEKIHEQLMTDSEALTATETDEFYVIKPGSERAPRTQQQTSELSLRKYTSDSVPLVSRDEIACLLSQLYARRQSGRPRK